MTKQEYEYKSVFQTDIKALLYEKKQYLNKTTIKRYKETLKLFDLWCIKNKINTPILNKELVENWMKQRETENSMTRSLRCSITRELAKNMIKNDKDAYIIPNKLYKGINEHKPYIYSDEEILKLIYYFENIKQDPQFCYRKETYSLIFKLLIYTGARKSEILNLKVKNIDFDLGIIHITQGKEYVDRDIPVDDALLSELKKYNTLLFEYGDMNSYFFSNVNIYTRTRNCVSKGALKDIFHKALKSCDIKYKGISEGPRIHDFRFTFVVKSIQKLINDGKDLNVYLPMLVKYLGHYSFNETLYYFKPIISIFNEINYRNNNLIPKLEKSSFYDE